MAVFFALFSALTYGASDFLGGLASRRSPVLAVVVLSQAISFPALLLLLLLLPAGAPSTAAWVWGALSGAAGGAGVAFLYRGLARGQMSVVEPVTAVGAALIPMVFGLAVGERPSLLAFVGIGVALVAIVAVSTAHPHTPGVPEPAGPGVGIAPTAADRLREGGLPRGVGDAVAASVAFGVWFIFLQMAGEEAGLWPLLPARIVSLGLLVAAAIVTRRSLRPAAKSWWLIVAAGLGDTAGNCFYLLATYRGLLSLVVVLTSLYPASTVMLARVVLGERLSRAQWVGVGGVLVGTVLIAGG